MPALIFSSLPIILLIITILLILVISTVYYFLKHRKKPHLLTQDLKNPHLFDSSSKEISELEDEFQKQLDQQAEKLLSGMESKANRAEDEFIQFLADLRTRSQQTQELLDSVKQERVEKLFSSLEQNVNQVINQTVKQTLTTIQQELDASRKFVTQYSQKQLSIIDQNLIDLLEKTLSIVLIKKLSLRDQLDLVYEALEKAKVEKFLVSEESNEELARGGTANGAPHRATAVSTRTSDGAVGRDRTQSESQIADQSQITSNQQPANQIANTPPTNPFIDTKPQSQIKNSK